MSEAPVRLETTRLILRQWRDEDLVPLAAMLADPRVMEFFPATLSRQESDALANRYRSLIDKRGWGIWAVERKDNIGFIGLVGLHIPSPKLPFSPCVEIGWRLAAGEWGKGLACEAARAALRFGFESLDLKEIVTFTTKTNQRSQALMRRLGMLHDTDGDFEHPELPADHPLRPHVLYRLKKKNFRF